MGTGTLPSTCNLPSDESSTPFYSTSKGYSKYFDERAQIRSESEVGNQSKSSLECKNPEHEVVELSNQNRSVGIANPEHAVVELSDKTKSLGITNHEHAVGELSDHQKINSIKISSADQRKDLETEILNIINEEHSKTFDMILLYFQKGLNNITKI